MECHVLSTKSIPCQHSLVSRRRHCSSQHCSLRIFATYWKCFCNFQRRPSSFHWQIFTQWYNFVMQSGSQQRRPICVFEYYPLAQPTFDSCTSLFFGYYTIARIPGRSLLQPEKPVSTTLIFSSTNIVQQSRTNATAATGVTFRPEKILVPSYYSASTRSTFFTNVPIIFKRIYDVYATRSWRLISLVCCW